MFIFFTFYCSDFRKDTYMYRLSTIQFTLPDHELVGGVNWTLLLVLFVDLKLCLKLEMRGKA